MVLARPSLFLFFILRYPFCFSEAIVYRQLYFLLLIESIRSSRERSTKKKKEFVWKKFFGPSNTSNDSRNNTSEKSETKQTKRIITLIVMNRQ